MTNTSRKWEIVQDIVMWAAPTIVSFFLVRQLLSHLADPEGKHEADQKTAAAARQKIQSLFNSREQNAIGDEDEDYPFGHDRPRVQDLQLSTYEQNIAMELVAPKDIPVSFKDIGGLDDIIEELTESVIYPLTMSSLYSQASSLLSAPSGVLLYGPPGCGKTMLAKALAHESGACFINLHISTLTEKWYGDSNKLVRAVFSLARKLEPTIVFIDEIDAVLGTRRSGEHEASGMVKAEFMTHWDGLVSANSAGKPQRICILGATNRMQDIDEAILRRMPKKFPVSLPNASQRRGIFKLVLKGTRLDEQNFNLDYLVKLSAGLSGSDIKEACRDAAMLPMREFIREKQASGKLRRPVKPEDIRGVQTKDFFRNPKNVALAAAGRAAQAAERGLEVDEVGGSRVVEVEEEDEPGWEDADSDADVSSKARQGGSLR